MGELPRVFSIADPLGPLSGVFFSDAATGTVVGGRGAILRTTDGGNSWLSQSSGTSNFLLGVAFLDAHTGIAVGYGGTILRTNTGGNPVP